MWPFAVLLAWPLTEIALFVVIGGQIGLWATLAWVLLSGVLGVLVLRLAALRQAVALRDGLRGLRDPARFPDRRPGSGAAAAAGSGAGGPGAGRAGAGDAASG